MSARTEHVELKRLVRTSSGWLALTFPTVRLDGSWVHVEGFEPSGWLAREETWVPGASAALAEVVARVGGIPLREAEQATAETLAGWERARRELPRSALRLKLWIVAPGFVLLSLIGPVVVLAVLGVGIWLLVRAV